MEIWLNEENGEKFRLPVLPQNFEINSASLISTIHINDLGNIGIFGGNDLKSITLSSFFPSKEYPFVEYTDLPKPYDIVEKFLKYKDENKKIRLIITETNINLLVMIESFNYGESDGTRDVYYTITLKEYREITVNKKTSSSNDNNNKPRPEGEKEEDKDKDKNKTHIVVKGETLWSIAKKYYGKGSKYTTIYNANKNIIKNPNLIYPGQKLVIPSA